MHNPIREHARTLASRMDPGDDRQQATARLLDYYQHAAARADALLTRHARSASPAGTTPAAVPVLASREQALAWARAERTSLLACLDQATAASQHEQVIALTEALGICRDLGDRPGQALALTSLGNTRRFTDDLPGAARDLTQELGIQLGLVQQLTRDYPAAAASQQRAQALCRDLDSLEALNRAAPAPQGHNHAHPPARPPPSANPSGRPLVASTRSQPLFNTPR